MYKIKFINTEVCINILANEYNKSKICCISHSFQILFMQVCRICNMHEILMQIYRKTIDVNEQWKLYTLRKEMALTVSNFCFIASCCFALKHMRDISELIYKYNMTMRLCSTIHVCRYYYNHICIYTTLRTLLLFAILFCYREFMNMQNAWGLSHAPRSLAHFTT